MNMRLLLIWNVVLSALLIIVLVIGINNINAIGENRSNISDVYWIEVRLEDISRDVEDIKKYNEVLHAYIEAENAYLNLIRTTIAPGGFSGGMLFPYPPFLPPTPPR